MLFKIMLVLFLLMSTCASEERTVFGKLKSGLQMAGKMLGLDQASGVADLVSEAFGKHYKKGDGGEGTGNIFSGFLRILGFDSKKIGAIAVNAIIFVAQLISSSLSRPTLSQVTEARNVKPGTPLQWMLDAPDVSTMMNHIKDKQLPNDIIEFIKERSLDEESDCVQLLVCKSSPFIWKMQEIVGTNDTIKGPKALLAHLPSTEEVAAYGDVCDRKHPYCFIDP